MALTGDAARVAKLAQSLGASKSKAEGAVSTVLSKPSSGGSSTPTTKPAYNAATGATTGTPSAEYNTYLKSLNKVGSPNYVPTGDEKTTPVAPTAPITPAGQLTDTEVANYAKQGFTEGMNVPGKGILSPDGTFKAPDAISADGTLNESVIRNQVANQTPPPGTDIQSASSSKNALKSMLPGEKGPTTTPQVNAFYNENKNVKAQSQELIDFLSPPSTQKMLFEGMKQIQSQQAQLGQDKLELMDLEAIMDGTSEDIAKEVEAGNGFATTSQIAAMTVARNSTLLKKATYLQNKISIQQDLVANSTQLLSFEKEMANTQFSQRMAVVQYQQQNNERMQNAFKDSISTIQKSVGWSGLLQTYQDNPRQLGYVESLYGGAGSVARLAEEEKRQQAIVSEEDQLNLELKRAQINATNRSNNGSGGGTSGKPISSATALNIADSNAAVEMLGNLGNSLTEYSNILGPIKGRFNAMNPYNTDAQYLQSLVNSTKQIVGKYLEGGVLRAEDEVKYEKILPKLSDTPDVAKEKLANVKRLVQSKIKAQQETLSAAGYNPAKVSSGNIVVGPDGNEYEITD